MAYTFRVELDLGSAEPRGVTCATFLGDSLVTGHEGGLVIIHDGRPREFELEENPVALASDGKRVYALTQHYLYAIGEAVKREKLPGRLESLPRLFVLGDRVYALINGTLYSFDKVTLSRDEHFENVGDAAAYAGRVILAKNGELLVRDPPDARRIKRLEPGIEPKYVAGGRDFYAVSDGSVTLVTHAVSERIDFGGRLRASGRYLAISSNTTRIYGIFGKPKLLGERDRELKDFAASGDKYVMVTTDRELVASGINVRLPKSARPKSIAVKFKIVPREGGDDPRGFARIVQMVADKPTPDNVLKAILEAENSLAERNLKILLDFLEANGYIKKESDAYAIRVEDARIFGRILRRSDATVYINGSAHKDVACLARSLENYKRYKPYISDPELASMDLEELAADLETIRGLREKYGRAFKKLVELAERLENTACLRTLIEII